MNYQDFEFIAELVTERSGIVMKSDKAFILEGRLAPLARREGLVSIEDLVHVMRSRREERLLSGLVDALVSNETSFFRGRDVFSNLRERADVRRVEEEAGILRVTLADQLDHSLK